MTLQLQSGIYSITNIVSGKCYIGSAVNLLNRWQKHKRDIKSGSHHSNKLQRAWDKYGESAFTFSVLLSCEKKDLIFYEQRAIDSFDSCKFGYNVSPRAGNQLGIKRSAETIKRMCAAQKGKKFSAETRAKIAATLTGRPGANKGMKHTQETKDILAAKSRLNVPSAESRAKMSAKAKGRIKTPEHCAKLAAANKGVPFTAERLMNMSVAHKGNKLPKESIIKREATKAANRAAKLLGVSTWR